MSKDQKFESKLKLFMKPEHRAALEGLPTTHSNCFTKTGVARPGKTAKDRSRKQ